MAASYKKLFKLLIDRDMKKKELAEKAGISIATIIAARGAVKCMSKTAIDEMIDKMPTYISKSLRRGKHYLCRDFSL